VYRGVRLTQLEGVNEMIANNEGITETSSDIQNQSMSSYVWIRDPKLGIVIRYSVEQAY